MTERERRIVEMFRDGRRVKEIAESVGITGRSVQRALVRLGARPPLDRNLANRERVRLLAAEGMPANWIAEDVGISASRTREHAKKAPGHAESVREWARVWQSIRRSDELTALHRQFAPREVADTY